MRYDAVIVASGKGIRANLGFNKVFYEMKDGKTVLEHAASLFVADEDCERIVVVTSVDLFSDVFECEKLIKVEGGEERKDSVRNGLRYVKSEYVLIHDGARPFLKKDSLEAVKQALVESDCVCLGHMASDTVKIIKDGKIEKTIDRNNVFMAETPQAFRTSLIKDCYEKIGERIFTDDSSLAEAFGYDVKIVLDDHDNRKLTSGRDFEDL